MNIMEAVDFNKAAEKAAKAASSYRPVGHPSLNPILKNRNLYSLKYLGLFEITIYKMSITKSCLNFQSKVWKVNYFFLIMIKY